MEKKSLYPLNIDSQFRGTVQRIVNELWKIERTGWVDRGVSNPETVGEHTDALVALAEEFFPEVHGLKIMLKVHDWPEIDKKIGDPRTDELCPEDHKWTLEQKREAETKAMEKICTTIGPAGTIIRRLWKEFEAGQSKRAKIAQQLDKFQMIIRAIKYQKEGEPVIAQEFIKCCRIKITEPILVDLLKKARIGLM